MNARLKLFFLANLSRQKIGSDRGFALPIALMVGLVILVVGATMIIRAQGDQSKIIAQTTSNKAMAVAEAGATRYVDFLNNNRGLIPYSACVTQDATTGACSDTSSVKSWYGAGLTTPGSSTTSIPNIVPSPSNASPSPSASPSCSTSTSGSSASLPSNYQSPSTSSSTIATWSNSTNSGISSGWRNVDLNDGSKGQYRLVSYRTYKDASASSAMSPDTDAPTTVASARLIVEGRVNQSGSGASATDGSNGGKARVEITIPVTATSSSGASPSPSSSNFPGLWAQDFVKFSSGNTSSNAYVWNSNTCITPNGSPLLASNVAQTSSNPLPTLPLTLASGVTDTANANNGNKQLYQGTQYNINYQPNKNIYANNNTVKDLANIPLQPESKKQAFPSLPNNGTFPNSSTPALVYGPNTTQTVSIQENSNCDISADRTFPRAGDKDSTNTITSYSSSATYTESQKSLTYVYRCSGGFSVGGSNVKLGRSNNDGKEKLIFYVNGTFNAGADGTLDVNKGTGNTWTKSVFYVNNDLLVKANGNVGRLLAPDALQFYVYNSGNKNPGVDVGGNGGLFAFVFAPTSITLQKGTTDTAGALWVKSLESNGNNKNWQSIFGDSNLMVDLPDDSSYTTYNLDGSPTAWKRVQAN
jgi:Tfp pilus assembly protein PilX